MEQDPNHQEIEETNSTPRQFVNFPWMQTLTNCAILCRFSSDIQDVDEDIAHRAHLDEKDTIGWLCYVLGERVRPNIDGKRR